MPFSLFVVWSQGLAEDHKKSPFTLSDSYLAPSFCLALTAISKVSELSIMCMWVFMWLWAEGKRGRGKKAKEVPISYNSVCLDSRHQSMRAQRLFFFLSLKNIVVQSKSVFSRDKECLFISGSRSGQSRYERFKFIWQISCVCYFLFLICFWVSYFSCTSFSFLLNKNL